MKAVHRMRLFWNEYISFAIVSHLDKVYTPLKFKKEWVEHKDSFL